MNPDAIGLLIGVNKLFTFIRVVDTEQFNVNRCK